MIEFWLELRLSEADAAALAAKTSSLTVLHGTKR